MALNRASQDSELYAGLENKMVVSVHTGSCGVEEGTLLALSCSRGLTVRMENSSTAGSQQLMMPLPAGKPFTNISVKVVVLAALVNQKDSTTIEHKVSIRDPWSSKETEIFVHFIPAFYTTFQLQTAMAKKFLQVGKCNTEGNFFQNAVKFRFSFSPSPKRDFTSETKN